MLRFNRRTITQEVRDEYARLLDNNPNDDKITQFIRDQYARLNLDRDQIFQIFEMLVGRQPNFENPENVSQFQNLPRDLVLNQRPQPEANQFLNQNMAAALQFVDDPFKGNINPGTAEGAKLYLKATASISDDDKFEIKITSAQKFVDVVTKDANTFGWGSLVRAIPSNGAGETKTY